MIARPALSNRGQIHVLFHALFLAGVLILLGAASAFAQLKPGQIIFGVAPGPYGDLVRHAVQPSLEKKGYKVVFKEFSDYVQPNLALANKDLDANVYQHRLYLEKFSADKGLKLSPVITIPTVGLGLYSRKVKSLKELRSGDEVTIANDPTNLARALRFLQKEGLLKIKADIDQTTASEKDIVGNPLGLKIRPIEAAQLPRSLDSVALSAVNGNYAIASGLKLSQAIVLEELDESIKNLVAVRTEDLDKQYVKDIRAVIESPEFATAVDDPNQIFKDFQKPQWLKDKLAKKK